MKEIRWGIVGPGNIANKFAAAIKNVEGARLVAVAARSAEKGVAFAKKHGIDTVFEGYEAMALSCEVDAVYVSTPHPFHEPCAELYLNNGKHVLCEKPICVNEIRTQKMIECARKNGVFLMEAMWTRFLPAIQKASELVKSGAMGEVLGLTADFCYRSSPEEEAKLFDNSMAGGSLLDVGVYCLTFADMILGAPKTIEAISFNEFDVDSHTQITMKYSSGAIASLSSATRVEKPANAYVYGTEGMLTIPDFYGAKEFFVTRSGKTERFTYAPIGDGFEEEIYEACNCIRSGKLESDVLPLLKSLEIIKQMDRIRRKIDIVYPFDKEI